jgi:hypothetical protein
MACRDTTVGLPEASGTGYGPKEEGLLTLMSRQEEGGGALTVKLPGPESTGTVALH